MSFAKRDQLCHDELVVQTTPYKLDVPKNGQKYLITFPYPYMNGNLHLGHAYTVSKAEFMSRFQELNGFDVKFPFGFHGTGMPIAACAQKLKEELESSCGSGAQIDTMRAMGIPDDELPNFVDPYYWLKYFPEQAKQDLHRFGANIDFSRSFITTDLNPHYDSFIRWQFNKLNKAGKLLFGKKPVIYSPKDQQPCADHDRSVGEGVEIKTFQLIRLKMDSPNLFLLGTTKNIVSDIQKVTVNSNATYKSFIADGDTYICSQLVIQNMKYQYAARWSSFQIGDDILGSELVGKNVGVNDKTVSVVDCPTLKIDLYSVGTGIMVDSVGDASEAGETTTVRDIITYYQPEQLVVSRSKDVCVVAIIDQWFIDYNDAEWKASVVDYTTNNLQANDDNIHNLFIKAATDLNQWPVSRSKGLGTKLLDTPYLIDSLSDSTIYTAYYTIAHIIESVPIEQIDDHFWDGIFLNQTPVTEEVMNMKKEFQYWYPVDFRVSGKDLIANHLTMSLYNHAVIWDKSKMPQRYHVNGHVLLNGEKMSKSTGNFITLADAVEKYGADPIRMALATAGSGIDDANFTDSNATNALLKLSSEKAWITSIIDRCVDLLESPIDNFWDKVFDSELDRCMDRVRLAYLDTDYQKVIVDGFYGMLSIRDSYKTKYEQGVIEPNYNMLRKFIEYHLIAIYPVCPHYAVHLWRYAESVGVVFNKSYMNVNSDPNYRIIYENDQLGVCIDACRSSYQNLVKRYKKTGKSCNNLVLTVITYKYSPVFLDLLVKIDAMLKTDTDWSTIFTTLTTGIDNKTKGVVAKFIKFVQGNVQKYRSDWIRWVTDECSDHDIINKWVPKLVNIPVLIRIEATNEFNDRFYPWCPSITLS
jgi:leucyl-tRNA synthetase